MILEMHGACIATGQRDWKHNRGMVIFRNCKSQGNLKSQWNRILIVGVRGSLSRDILSLRTMSRGWVAEEVLVRSASSLAGGGP